jgi:deoxyribodipyrimidine photo-lyase
MTQHLLWFRRDLRLIDNAALYHALKSASIMNGIVNCVFILDSTILQYLPKKDRRINFIWDSLIELDAILKTHGGALHVLYGNPVKLIPELVNKLQAITVYINHDDEPQALERDIAVAHALAEKNVNLYSYKDHVIFERSEVMSQQGKPYSVFTPYKNAWLKKLATSTPFYTTEYPVERYTAALNINNIHKTINTVPAPWPDLVHLGFDTGYRMITPAGESGAQILLEDFIKRMPYYHSTRDFPAIKGPSYLSVHLRFGTISIRQLVNAAFKLIHTDGGKTWLNELIWRDFYHQIMHHHPHAMSAAFKAEYQQIKWATGTQAHEYFAAWCEGRTGYPLVDAAQRQLNQTGYMHNRLRMVSACFLIKDLGIDWRDGEAYFAKHLNDFDLAGCDAQPYFRIFNPITQSEKFDAQGNFIRRYVPELALLNNTDIHMPWLASSLTMQAAGIKFGVDYPLPIIDHAQARLITLSRYAIVKSKTIALP